MTNPRHLRAVRQIGGFAGGTSRLARPPAVLEEPDIRPGGGSYRVPPIASHGTSGSGQVQLDHAAGVQTGEDRILDFTNTFRIGVPAGDYTGATAHLDFQFTGTNEVDLEVFDSTFAFVDFDTTIASATSVTASVGAFTIPVGGGYVRMQYGTSVDPNEILLSSYLLVEW